MAKRHDNEFKAMIVDLLKSGMRTKQLSDEYGLHSSVINRWRREYESKGVDMLTLPA
jgi:transposase